MFQVRKRRNTLSTSLSLLELIYHSIVRASRKSHSNALIGLMKEMLQAVIFVAVFFLMFSVFGLRGTAIRGDFLLYVMSGIFIFLTHTKTMGAVAGAEGPASPMMQHAPMNTLVAICAAGFGALYTQVLTLFVILFIYHIAFTPLVIEDATSAFGMFLVGWFTGFGIGVVALALKPWAPGFIGVFTQLYQRANMLASGKMFVANTLPSFMISLFDWNPLFHSIDQARGFIFINYNPHYSSVSYPVILGFVFLMVGMMIEFYTRKNASASWQARR